MAELEKLNSEAVAIIGMAGRFPGANDIHEFWRNLREGSESISFFSDAALQAAGVDLAALARDASYVRARGILSDPGPEWFDAAFFGIAPKEAELMDPQQRLFLETAWQALENAGCDPDKFPGVVGVFGGATKSSYFLNCLLGRTDIAAQVGENLIMLGNDKDYLTTRVSYKLNLKGPSVNISNACSTSLVAVCQAWQSLLTYQCDMALAGGVSVVVPQERGYYFQEGNIASPDGHCRTFDASAQGTVFSNGVGIVVLKRLADALSDGDPIWAIIKGAAVNNDGSAKVSFAAPSVDGQAEVISLAQAIAGVDAASVSYVEAHGTATPLGDPIEIAGLTQAFRASTEAKQFCAIGSVKSNIGHLDVAAGVAGLIKTALALWYKELPPSLHFANANPKIDLANSPFYVNTQRKSWPGTHIPRRAGVSSFGTGSTNAHVVLEEAPPTPSAAPSRSAQLLVLSAQSAAALARSAGNLAEHLEADTGQDLADVAFTLQTGRRSFAHRGALACRDRAEAVTQLLKLAAQSNSGAPVDRAPVVAFMFPGQGAQFVNMGRGLYGEKGIFYDELNSCAEILTPRLGLDIRPILYPDKDHTDGAGRLNETRVTQPALFAVEYALAQQWLSWGIQPAALIGHSLGEYVAACLAGVMTRDDALLLLAERARLMQSLPTGAMLAVRLAHDSLAPRLTEDLAVAAINSPVLTIVSGPHDPIRALEERLAGEKIVCKRLGTSHAFHTPMLDPILKTYGEIARRVKFCAPQIPWASSLTGQWVSSAQPLDAEYWVKQMRQPVRFADALGTVTAAAVTHLLEIGPGRALSTFARQHPGRRGQEILTSLDNHANSELDRKIMLQAAGCLWSAGAVLDWAGVHDHQARRKVALPSYPFERKYFWLAAPEKAKDKEVAERAVALKRQENIDSPTAPPVGGTSAEGQGAIMNQTPRADTAAHRERILARLQSLFNEITGIALAELSPSAAFADLGLDSLILTQVSAALQKQLGVKVSFRQLLEGFSDLSLLTDHVARLIPAPPAAVVNGATDGSQTSVPVASTPLPSTRAPALPANALERIFAQQLDLMQQQLDMLRGGAARSATTELAAPPRVARETRSSATAGAEPRGFGPYKPVSKNAGAALTARQQEALDALTARYTAKTQKSKALAAAHRAHLADPRVVSGFRSLWKELVYPIVTDGSAGSQLWDVDGNAYIDLTSGFGAIFFGHSPAFVTAAVEEQLKRGIEIGPQSPLAGKVAQLLCELTGMERAAFCNTGSEAVLAAMRIARTVSGRDKIVTFSGDYHGIFDEVVVRSANRGDELKAIPAAPGIPNGAGENMIVLDYDDPRCLAILRAHADEIAAVIVEPVPGRRLDFQPKEFLQELRRVTAELGIALIFDEIVTGFRVHLAGMQAVWGIRADMATYGKVIGGGLPIGVVAGKAQYLDALDGGAWRYGDDSAPEVGMTYFAGTFVRHPLALAAAWACLNYLKDQGPQLQEGVNRRTQALVERLRRVADEMQLPVRVPHHASIFTVEFAPEWPLAQLFYVYMRDKGIHIWEGRSWILTTAHSDADVEQIVSAFKESLAEMQSAGFLPAPRAVPQREFKDALAEVEPTEPGSRLPMTAGQREIWLAAQLSDQASLAFADTVLLRLQGPLDCQALMGAINRVVARHDALRAVFDREGRGFTIVDNVAIDVPIDDLSEVAAAARGARLEALARADNRNPFALERGPLLRARIVKYQSDDHTLVLTTHHIVVDGWSHGVLFRELGALYSALCAAAPDGLAAAPQFADYARWQQSGAHGEDQAYWLAQLAEPATPLDLPSDRPHGGTRSYQGAQRCLVLPVELCAKLRAVTARQRTTLFVTLLAGFNALIHRLSGQTDFVVGIAAAGQMPFDAPELVGHCVNFLPLRTRLDPETTVADYCAKVRTLVLDAYEHQNTTYGALLEKLNLPRDPGRPPLVSVSFNLDKADRQMAFAQLTAEVAALPRCGATFDAEINVVESGAQIAIEWQYQADLFDQDTIERWLAHYQTLLEALVDHKERRIFELPLLSAGEARQLMVYGNAAARGFVPEKCLHQLFEEQARRTPDAVAVVCAEQSLTYGQLNRRADRIAQRLRRIGVGPDILVALCAERSVELVVGLLAILKAGGAYLPLDPGYPTERLQFILEDARAKILLTDKPFGQNGRAGTGLNGALSNLLAAQVTTVLIDADDSSTNDFTEPPVAAQVAPDNLAYVIYTSGSTGKPKGALITHYNVVRLFQATEPWFGFTAGDVWTLFHSYAFDFSVWEIWGALLYGGKLVVVPHEVSRAPEEFAALIKKQRVTILNQTPSAFRPLIPQMIAAVPAEEMSLRTVIFGGEALDYQSLAPWFECYGEDRPTIVNMYGITETTVHVTYRRVVKADLASPVGSAIGQPIPDLKVYLLDAHRQLVPTGVAGEIYVGGGGLARGYLQRPELTAERFIADPFAADATARLYRSGDLARWLPSGELAYLGRIDDQIKLRGFRIELGEIESLLNQQATVRQAAVVVREDVPGDRRLVAYIVPQTETVDLAAQLNRSLAQRLPEYMIPGAFVSLAKLPLNANGKLDRGRLPKPADDACSRGANFVAPRTELERAIAAIWAELLQRQQVGVGDNFFHLGGHSLLATQVVSRVRAALQAELSIRDLFRYPTVAELAQLIESARAQSSADDGQDLMAIARPAKLPLSFAQERLWFLDRLKPGEAAYNIPWAMRLTGRLDREILERSFNEILRRHETLRSCFAMDNGAAVQNIAASVELSLPMRDLSHLAEPERAEETRRLMDADARAPFDLTCAPLFRAELIRLAPNAHVLFVNFHHMIFDHWSIDVLFGELSRLYQAFATAQPSPLPVLAIQYPDFAIWQRERLQGKLLETQLSYWKAQLADIPASLDLPTDHPRPPKPTLRGATEAVVLPKELQAQLAAFSRQEGVTLFMTFLAAFQILLHRCTGQSDIVVGSPISGRNRQELEGLIGMFLNMLALRTRIDGAMTVRQTLAQVRETALEAFAHQELPFERLVEELNPARDLSRAPIFQVMFVFQNRQRQRLRIAGVEVAPIEIACATAKFDMTLLMEERSDGVQAVLEYNRDLFEAETIRRWLGHLETLLGEMVAAPDQRVDKAALLTPAQSRQLRSQWNQTRSAYPSDRCVHELFDSQAREHPEAVAIIVDDRRLTYGELNARANQLARYLIRQGAEAASSVAVCMERSPEVVVSLLAILKAGAVYVPLDPHYPQDRLAFMLADGQVKLVLSKQAIAKILPAQPPVRVVCVDGDWPEIARETTGAPESRSAPDDLAYIIYTSGSTGIPKGVLGHHRGLVNRFHWMWQRYPFAAGEVCCQKTSLSFVDSLSELLGPLLRGVPTWIVADDDAKNPEALIATLGRGEVSRIVVVPSLLRAMLDRYSDLQARLPKLRFWVSSGEALTGDLVLRFRRSLPKSRLINLYGSSEVAADVTFWEAGEENAALAPVPIGRPIANTQAYILDTHLNPVPVGVPGMLYIGGAGVAHGYHNRDDLTAERFFRHSFDGEPEQRLFKTGDRARYLPDGHIEYLGRADNQVKIRGCRVELGEIEAVLARHSAVRQAAVVAQQDGDGNPALSAYIVMRDPLAVSVGELRDYLRTKVPDYMVPSAFVPLDTLPLTPNGKLDLKALPAPGERIPDRGEIDQAARTTTEQQLMEIWAGVLKVKTVDIHDNFFDLGGHSLLAVRLFAEIAWKLNKRLPLAVLFERPTIAQLAPLLAEDERAIGASVIPIQPNGSKPPFFLVDAVYAYTRLASHFGSDQPVYGLADYLAGQKVPPRTIAEMAAGYVAEIRKLQPAGPYYLGGHSLGALVAFEMAKQLRDQAEEVALVALVDPMPPGGFAERPSMGGRIRQHLDNLAKLGLRESFDYFLNWVQVEYRVKLLNPSKSMMCALYHRFQKPLPPNLLKFYIYEVYYPTVYYQASTQYRPDAYSANVVCLFSESQRSSVESWQTLVGATLEVHKIRGDHLSVLLEPHVQETVEILKRCLDKAQAGAYRVSWQKPADENVPPALTARPAATGAPSQNQVADRAAANG